MPSNCAVEPKTSEPTASHLNSTVSRAARATAVIVTYQSRTSVEPALVAAREAHRLGMLDCIVLDNASTDATADFIAAEHPWATLIRSDRNHGFGCGCNIAFQHVRTPYLLLLNPDAVLNARGLRTLLQFMQQHPKAGIAAPATLDEHGGRQCAGTLASPSALLRCLLGKHQHAYPKKRTIQPGEAPFQTTWVCGAIMLIRSELFRKLGGFDERFFLYFEETDLCRRAEAIGAEIWAVGSAVATHSGSASAKQTGDALYTSCIAAHYLRSRRRYLTKHYGLARGLTSEVLLRTIEKAHHWRKTLRQQ